MYPSNSKLQDLYCQGLTNHQLSEAEQALFFPQGAFYGQAYMQDLAGSQELLQPNKPPPAYPQSPFMQPMHSPNAGNIPDIILTGGLADGKRLRLSSLLLRLQSCGIFVQDVLWYIVCLGWEWP